MVRFIAFLVWRWFV